MRLRPPCVMCLLAVLITMIPGCTAPTEQQIVDGINKVGPTIIYDILKEVPAQATAKKDAAFISTAMTTDIIPFVNNNSLPAAQFIPQLKALLGAKITNTAYYGAISAVITMATLNVDITAPAMTANETAYVQAACNAINTGCNAFATGKIVRHEFYDVHKAHQECMKKELQNPKKALKSQIAIQSEESKDGASLDLGRIDVGRDDSISRKVVVGSDGQRLRADSFVNCSWTDIRREAGGVQDAAGIRRCGVRSVRSDDAPVPSSASH